MLNRLLGFFGQDVAIDLGTANTLISVVGEGLILNEPSVVALERGSNRILSDGCAIGHLAKQMSGRTPDSISIVRPLRDGVIADYRLCESMLRYFLNKTGRGKWRTNPRAIVTVPGCITAVERRAVFNSTQRAGVRRVFLLHEAKAAAMGCGLPIAEPLGNMICDIGGGTTEVAIMSLGSTVAQESIRIGGNAMDQAICDFLLSRYQFRVGLPSAEMLRIDIGSAYPLDEEISVEVNGVDTISGLPRKMTITSEEVRSAVSVPLELIILAIKRTLDACEPDLIGDLLSYGMTLVGGGSLLRGIDRYITDQTGIPATVSPEALIAVAKGAQLCIENLSLWQSLVETSNDI